MILRRIIGKCVVTLLKPDIQLAAGGLQMCTGIRSGIEAAVHMNEKAWNDEDTEAVLLVDANNASNRLNRKAALHNTKEICPPIYTFLCNQYQTPAKLIVPNASINDSDDLNSDEGATQGDVAAMAFYALGIKPLVDELDTKCCGLGSCKQSWYADDSGAVGKLAKIRIWWDTLNALGPKYGYYPNPSKTVLLLKNSDDTHRAGVMFRDTGIQVKTDGQRYLGAALGSNDFKSSFVNEKILKWVNDVNQLAEIANEEPQIALSAYTKGICHRWSFIQRTMGDINHLFSPLEDAIRDNLIPAIVGRKVSDIEREVMSLPVRFGGLGIANPMITCMREYQSSVTITEDLTDLLYRQQKNLSLFDANRQLAKIKELKTSKESWLSNSLDDILSRIESPAMIRAIELNKEKGAGSWLTVLPLQQHGYCLNKQEFRDAICLRYGWDIPNIPPYCACDSRNNVDHTLICKKGGFVSMRHNNLRDLNADLQRNICRDVVIEPSLLPLNGDDVQGAQGDRAAPDISSRGLWSTFERTFYDVRVCHPNAPSHINSNIAQLYRTQEQEKMRKYNARIMTVERGSFTPLIYTTFGGWGPQATRYHKRLAGKVAQKSGEQYHHVLGHMRVRVRFAILRSVLIALRGERGKKQSVPMPFSSTSFNLIPEGHDYECF